MAKSLPKLGDKVPADSFHVSKLNVRAEEPFGEADDDKALMHQLYRGDIVEPFKARPEGDGYGVYVGRRRFLAKKAGGATFFVVGRDVVVGSVDEETAVEESWIENLDLLRKSMNPITRAQKLEEQLVRTPSGLRGLARRLGVAHSTLSEWMKILELPPRMQEAVAREDLGYTEAVRLAKMGLSTLVLDELAETLETEGAEAFTKGLERVTDKGLKRGIPKDVYEVDRVLWDKRNPKEMKFYETVRKTAEARGMKAHEYIKDFVLRHIDMIKSELEEEKMSSKKIGG